MDLNHHTLNQKQVFELLKETTDYQVVKPVVHHLPCTFEVQELIELKFPYYCSTPQQQRRRETLPQSEQDELNKTNFVHTILDQLENEKKNKDFFAQLFASERQFQLKRLDNGESMVDDQRHQGMIPRELTIEMAISENPYYFGVLPELLKSYRLARFAKRYDVRLSVGCRYYNLEWLEWLDEQKQKKRGVRL